MWAPALAGATLGRRQLALIAAVALVARLIHLWFLRDSPFFSTLMGDARGYDEWAQRIAAGDWMGSEVFYQAPLYPYFLGTIYAVFGHDLLTVRVIQALLGSTACILLAMAGARLFSPRVGLIAGLMLAAYAPALFMDSLIQKSILDVFFICLSIWLVSAIVDARAFASPSLAQAREARGPLKSKTSNRLWFALGLALGALSLTRENAIVLVAVVVTWVLVQPGIARAKVRAHNSASDAGPSVSDVGPGFSRGMAISMLVLGLAIVLTPVAVRNKAVGGGFYLTTSQFGSNLYIGNNPRSDGTYISMREGRGDPQYERQDATELAERAIGRRLTPAEVSTYWRDRTLQYISTQPGHWLTLMGRKVRLLFNATEMLDTESQESHAEWSPVLRVTALVGHFGVLLPLAAFGVIATWPERRRLWVVYAMTLGYAASVVMFFVFARYRYPLVPFLMLLAAAGVAAFPDFVRAASRRRQAFAAAVVAGLAAFAQWPVLDEQTMRAITHTNLAVALQERQQFAEATTHYRRAIEIKPDHAPAYSNMGVALRALGKLDEAITAYRRALQLRSDYSDAQFNLANALMQRGDTDAAIVEFQHALATAPDKAGAHNNFAIALAGADRLDDAIAQFHLALAIEPRSVTVLRNLGDALARQQRYSEAVAYLRKAVDVDPRNAASHYDLGSVLLESGQFSAAIDAFRLGLQHAPDAPAIHNNLGIALASTGRMAEAIVEFERALAIDPAFADARKNLARAMSTVDGPRSTVKKP